jgi:hypothetical protein
MDRQEKRGNLSGFGTKMPNPYPKINLPGSLGYRKVVTVPLNVSQV